MLLRHMPTLGRGLLACALALAGPHALAHRTIAASAPVAWVNEQPISRTLLVELLKLRMASQAVNGVPKTPTAQDRERAMDDLIRMEVMSQKAAALGLSTSAPAQADLDYQRKSVLGQRLMRVMSEYIQIDEAALQARYQAIPTQVELSANHILLANEAAARKVIAQRQRGTAFATLARQHSIDTESRQKGGQLDTALASTFAPAFAGAALALQPGQSSREPVSTELGWHVIELRSKKVLPKPSLEETRTELHAQMVNEEVEAQVERWRDESTIELLQTLDDKPLPQPSGTVARLNGQDIPRLALEQLVNARNGMANRSDPAPPQAPSDKAPAAVAGREPILRELLRVELLAQKANERGLMQNVSVAAEISLQDKTLASRMYVRHLMGQTQITPEELRAFYDAEVPALSFKVSQIVRPSQADARALIEQLKQGQKFAALARQHSIDAATRGKGGDMGWLLNQQMKPSIAAATRRLNVGEHSREPVQTEEGWHVIYLQATRPAPRPDLATATAWLHPKLMHAKVQAQLDQAKAEATIKRAP